MERQFLSDKYWPRGYASAFKLRLRNSIVRRTDGRRNNDQCNLHAFFARVMLNKLESREAQYTERDGMYARQPWNDVNVINITFRDRRCIDELAFRIHPHFSLHPFSRHSYTRTSCKVFTCVNCVNILRGGPFGAVRCGLSISSAVCYSRRDHWSDKVTRKWSVSV